MFTKTDYRLHLALVVARRFLLPGFAFLAAGGFTIGIIALVIPGEQRERPLELWAESVYVFPGQNENVAAHQGFTCGIEHGDEVSCNRDLDTGIFSRVNIIISERTIRSVYYFVRKDALRVGDVAFYWGRPDNRILYGNLAYVDWPDRGISTITPTTTGRFSYLLPVSWLYLSSPISQ